MTQPFEIAIESWITEETAEPEIQATAAELSIAIGPHRATHVEDRLARTVRTTIRVSAMPIAIWLLDNWWRLRWEPSRALPIGTQPWFDWGMSHILPSIGAGYVWPPLTFASEGNLIIIDCNGSADEGRSELSSIRYLNSFKAVVDAASFQKGVWSFVETVIARLDSLGYRKTMLHQLWAETNEEIGSSARSLARRMEAALGLDPDQQGPLIGQLVSTWSQIGANALWEVAAASEPDNVNGALHAVSEASHASKALADLHELESIRNALVHDFRSVSIAPWLFARTAAQQLRDLWNLGSGAVETSALASRLGTSIRSLDEIHPSAPFAVGVKGSENGKLRLVLNRKHEHSRRFDIARLIGDWLTSTSSDSWCPATKGMTVRQKTQRAFAAEFLCPSDELVRRFSSPLDLDLIDDAVEEIAHEFRVSEMVVLSHFVNRGLAPRYFLESGIADTWDGLSPREKIGHSDLDTAE